MARPAYKNEAAPKVVTQGTVSKPKPLPRWRPKNEAAPRQVKAD